MPRRPSAPRPLDAHLGYWLRFVSNHVSHAFSQKLAGKDVTVAEWVVLRELFDGMVAAPSAIAERLGMTRGAISKLVDRLASKELLCRTKNLEDGRYQAVTLTPAGRALVPELAALADANDDAFFGHLSPPQRSAIEEALKDIVRRHDLRTVPIA